MKPEKSAYRPVRCSAESDDTLGRLATQRHTSKSEVLRYLVDRGLVSIGVKADEDYLVSLVRQAIDESLKPQVERLAAISAKAAHISGAAFWYSKKHRCKMPMGVSHLRLFFCNKRVIGPAWPFWEQSLRHENCPPSLIVNI